MDPEAPDKELEAAQTILMMMEVGAEREPGNDGPSGTGGESSGSALGLRPRVKPCEGCKRRRKRCDAVRPVCGTCAKLRVSCEWTPEHSSGLVSTIAAHDSAQRAESPCESCHLDKTHCDQTFPVCTPCLGKPNQCKYPTPTISENTTPSSPSPSATSSLAVAPQTDKPTNNIQPTQIQQQITQHRTKPSCSTCRTFNRECNAARPSCSSCIAHNTPGTCEYRGRRRKDPRLMSCARCQRLHLKCDNARPSCGECSKRGRDGAAGCQYARHDPVATIGSGGPSLISMETEEAKIERKMSFGSDVSPQSLESGSVVAIEEGFRNVQMDVAEPEQENEQSTSSSSACAMEAHTSAMDSQVQRRNDEQLEGHDHQPQYPRYNDAGPKKAGPVGESGDALIAGSRAVIQSLFTDAPAAQQPTEKSLHTDGGGGRKTLRAISSGEDSASNSEGNGGDDNNAGKEGNASGDDSSSSQERHHRHNQHTLHVQRQQNKEQAQRVQERRDKKHELEQHHQVMIQQRVEQQMTDQQGKEVADESPSNGQQVQNPFHHHHHHYYHHHHYSNDGSIEQDQPEQQQHLTQQYMNETSPSTVLASPRVESYPVHPIYHPTQEAQQQYQQRQHQQYQEQLQYQHQQQQRNQQFQHPQALSQYGSHYYQQQYDHGQLQQQQQQQNHQHQQMAQQQRQYQQQPSTDMQQSQQQQQGQHHHHHVYYHQVASAPLGRFTSSAPSAPTTTQSVPSAASQKTVSKPTKSVASAAKPPVAQPAAANLASKTRIASCWTCYKKKVKCDRSRPRCGFCHARGLACEYPSPKAGGGGGGDEILGAAEIITPSVTIAHHQSAEKSRVSTDLRGQPPAPAAAAAPSSTPAHPTIDTKPIADPKPSKNSFSNLLPTGSVPSPAEGSTLSGSFVPSPSHHLRAFSNVLEEGWTPSPVPDGDFSTPKHVHQQQRGGSSSSNRNSSTRVGAAAAVDAKGVAMNVTYAEVLKAGLLGGGLQSRSRSLGKNE